MHADAVGAYVSAHDVLLQLLRVKLLALSVVTHKPLVTVGDVKTTVQCTLQKESFSLTNDLCRMQDTSDICSESCKHCYVACCLVGGTMGGTVARKEMQMLSDQHNQLLTVLHALCA